jgi:cell division protease FtsH
MNSTMKNLMFWMVAALALFLFWSVSARIQKNERRPSFSDFMEQLERGHVARVTLTSSSAGSRIEGEFKNGQSFRTFAPSQFETLGNILLAKGVQVDARDVDSSSWPAHFISFTPILIVIAFLVFFLRQRGVAASRFENRLRAKAQIYELLSRTANPLSDDEVFEELSEEKNTELRIVLYEMLRDGTVVFTSDRKYRARTVD